MSAQVGVTVGLIEDPGLHIEGLGRDAQGFGDLLEDLGRRAAQAPLDLAEVRVGDAGQFGEAPQREAGRVPLLANERAKVGEPIGKLLDQNIPPRAGLSAQQFVDGSLARLVALDDLGLKSVDPLVERPAYP